MSEGWGKRWRRGVIILMALSFAVFAWAEGTILWWNRVGIRPVQAAVTADQAYANSVVYASRWHNVTREELEQTLNGGQPFQFESQETLVQHTTWTNPRSGLTWRLSFVSNGQLGGFRVLPPADPWAVQFSYQLRQVRRWVLVGGVMAWLLCLTLWLIYEHLRYALAWLMVSVAVFMGLIFVLIFVLERFPARFLHMDWCPLTWLTGTLLLSWRLLSLARKELNDSLNVCRGCGYDLTGNLSGRCPECGRPAPPRKQEPDPAAVAEALKRMAGE